MMRSIKQLILGLLLMCVMIFPQTARAGLYEMADSGEWKWHPEIEEEDLSGDVSSWLVRNPRKLKLVDERFDPKLMLRVLYVTTQEDAVTPAPAPGQNPQTVESNTAPTSVFGHREGFVMENVEIGMEGRFNKLGLYYKTTVEFLPREKDGTSAQGEYIKDAYFGWDYYSVFDIRIGRMKIPFSQVNNTSTSKRVLISSPILNTQIPKRQLGAMVAFSDPWQAFKLSGGVYNSVKTASQQMRNSEQLLYTARADFRIDNVMRAFKVQFLDFYFNIGASWAWVKKNFDPTTEHRWFGFDAKLHLYVVTLSGEMVVKDYYSGDVLTDGTEEAVRAYGWHADAVIHAWPKIIDLVFRIEKMDGDNRLAEPNSNLSVSGLLREEKLWYTIGMTIHLYKYVRLDMNYVIREEIEGYDFNNNAFIGMLQFNL